MEDGANGQRLAERRSDISVPVDSLIRQEACSGCDVLLFEGDDLLYYNFVRVHQTLCVTPATDAGFADRVWSIEEIIALLK